MRQRIAKSVFIVFLFLLSGLCFAEQNDSLNMVVKTLADGEVEDDHKALLLWNDSEMVKTLSEATVTDDYVKSLYSEFKNTIVTPPNPDTYKEYSIENAEGALERVSQLGRRIHNFGLAMSDDSFKKYGVLIQCMRDALYIDYKHIPLAIRHDNSRDVYWYDLHNKLVKEVNGEYEDLFGNKI